MRKTESKTTKHDDAVCGRGVRADIFFYSDSSDRHAHSVGSASPSRLLFNESKKAAAVADRHRTKIAKGLRSEIALRAKVISNEMGDGCDERAPLQER